MKLWGGRFQKNTDKSVDEFGSSIKIDLRMYKEDIMGSIAHATMLGKQGIIPQDDAHLICRALLEILDDIEKGKAKLSVDAEDIHMNIEKLLTEKIGDAGKKLHTGRSRNDQVALDFRMYLINSGKKVKDELIALCNTLADLAEGNLETVMPGYTHLQRAQPTTLAHHFMAYAQMFARDISRLEDAMKRTSVMPLGSGALAGTTYPLDRGLVADALGFLSVSENSMDAVSDRDFAIEFIFVCSLVMMHLSRFSEELVLWSSSEFSFIEIDDAYSTGSSIMPQKKNPDVAELIRGKTGRVYGDLIGLLTVMKGLPLAYNKDMQEDKEQTFDALDTVLLSLPVFRKMIETMKTNKEKMENAVKGGFTNATDAADYLVSKGLPFRDAHEVVGKLVFHAVSKDKTLEDLTIDEFREFSPLFDKDIYSAIDIKNCISKRSLTGGPAPDTVKKTINDFKNFLKSL